MGDPLHAWGWNIFGVWHRNTLRKKKLFISMGTCLKYQSCRKEKKKNYLFLLSEKKETEKRRRTLLASFFSPSRRLHANPSFGANSRRLCLAPVWSLAEKERERELREEEGENSFVNTTTTTTNEIFTTCFHSHIFYSFIFTSAKEACVRANERPTQLTLCRVGAKNFETSQILCAVDYYFKNLLQ